MNLTKNILFFFILSFVLSACDIEPDVMEKRLFKDSSQTQAFTLYPPTADLSERLCAPTDKLVNADSSGPDWLKRDWIDPTTQQPVAEVGPIAYVVLQIKTQLNAAIQVGFQAFENNTTFQEIIVGLLTIAVAFYGIGIIAGIIPTQPYPLVINVIKYTLIIAVVSKYQTFKAIVQDFFEGIVDGLIIVMSSNFSTNTVTSQEEVFNPADDLFAQFFSMEHTILYVGLLLTGWTGFFYAFTMLLATLGFLFGVLRAVYIYLTALVVRALLYVLAPIFIPMAMMKATRSLFDGWLQQLVSFTLQPVLLFAFLAVFLEIIKSFMGIMHVTSPEASHICYMEWIKASEGTQVTLYKWSFTGPQGVNTMEGVTPEISVNLVVMFSFMVLSYVMVMFGTWAVEVANHMAAGFISVGGAAAPGWANLRQRMLRPVSGAAGAARGATSTQYHDPRGFVSDIAGFGGAAGQGDRVGKESQKRIGLGIFGRNK